MSLLTLVTGCGASPGPASTTLPLSFRHGLPVVPATIDGRQLMMTIDTGANTSYVSASLAGTLPQAPPTRTLTVAGTATGRRVNLASLTLGHIQTGPLVVGVGDLPVSDPTDGALGLDILGKYDLELRPRQGIAILWQGTCNGSASLTPTYAPPYAIDAWPAGAPLSPAWLNGHGQFIVPLSIEGHPLDAMIDTGATDSLMRADTARLLGANDDGLAHDPEVTVMTFAEASLTLRAHRFASVRLAGGPATTDRFIVGEMPLPTDALLGMDMLRADRILLGFAHGIFGRTGG